MENALIILKQILIMFFYMAIGCLLYHRKLVSKEGSKSMAHLLLYVVLPCVVIRSFCVERTPEKMRWLLISMIGAVILLLLAMVVSHVLFRKNAMDDFGASFSNAGFMGFPLITAVLGSDAVFYAAGFVALLNALQWTYGQGLLAHNWKLCSPKMVIKNPLILALLAGMAVFFFGIPLPGVLQSGISSLAALNGPLAMIILGIYLAQTDVKSMFMEGHLYLVSAVRLILIPLQSLLIMNVCFKGNADIATSLMIACCAPIGSNVAVYAQKLDLDYTYAVKLVCMSTILSIITMPLIIMLMNG